MIASLFVPQPTAVLEASRPRSLVRPTFYNYLLLSLCCCILFPIGELVAQQSDPTKQFRPRDVVIKIHKSKIGFGVKTTFGTGWCLDPNCGLVVSNYHVAMSLDLPLSIGGQKVLQRQLATSATDEGAIWMNFRQASIPPMKYVPSRDIALFELARPLASTHKGMHGIGLSPSQVREGEEVTVYSFSGGGKMVAFPGTFVRELEDGVLEFAIKPSTNGELARPGVSGGIVVNRDNQAVGLVWGIGKGDKTLDAVPIWTLADFVKRCEPTIYSKLFPQQPYRPDSPTTIDAEAESDYVDKETLPSQDGISPHPVLSDLYLKYETDKDKLSSPPLPSSVNVLQHRDEEPIDIQTLRLKAQGMVDDMENFTAIQTLHFGGAKTAETTAQDEVQVVYGRQVFRKLSNGKNQAPETSLSPPSAGVIIGAEWSTLPSMIGTNLKLKIQKTEDQEIEGRKVKVFRYDASIEDNACGFTSFMDYGFFLHKWTGAVKCHGEVWTDENLNILRITENEELPAQKTTWQRVHIVVIYGWLDEQGNTPKLLPVDVIMTADFGDRKRYWCRGSFSNYHMFSTDVKVGSNVTGAASDGVISSNGSDK